MPKRKRRVSTAELLAAAGVSRATLYRWRQLGLIPAPACTVSDGTSRRSYYSPDVLVRVAWIKRHRGQGYSAAELVELLDQGDGQ